MAKRKRKAPARKRKASGFKKCKYVARLGTKRMADKLAANLRRNCFRPLVSKPAGGEPGFDIFSCGKLKGR